MPADYRFPPGGGVNNYYQADWIIGVAPDTNCNQQVDGVADNVEIAAALAAVDHVHLNPGTFMIAAQINMPSYKKLSGSGYNTTMLQRTADTKILDFGGAAPRVRTELVDMVYHGGDPAWTSEAIDFQAVRDSKFHELAAAAFKGPVFVIAGSGSGNESIYNSWYNIFSRQHYQGIPDNTGFFHIGGTAWDSSIHNFKGTLESATGGIDSGMTGIQVNGDACSWHVDEMHVDNARNNIKFDTASLHEWVIERSYFDGGHDHSIEVVLTTGNQMNDLTFRDNFFFHNNAALDYVNMTRGATNGMCKDFKFKDNRGKQDGTVNFRWAVNCDNVSLLRHNSVFRDNSWGGTPAAGIYNNVPTTYIFNDEVDRTREYQTVAGPGLAPPTYVGTPREGDTCVMWDIAGAACAEYLYANGAWRLQNAP